MTLLSMISVGSCGAFGTVNDSGAGPVAASIWRAMSRPIGSNIAARRAVIGSPGSPTTSQEI
jgi:hypothetical protein